MEVSSSIEGSSPPSRRLSSPVRLADRIEELLCFTLSSFVDGTLGVDLPFSKDYCSRLLQKDPHVCPDPDFDANVSCGTWNGVPPYPLYKRLGWAIGQCVSHGTFLKGTKRKVGTAEVELVEGKEKEWSDLIAHTGSKLLNIFEAIELELHVQEPFFSQLKDGLKTVEGRCAIGNFNQIASGALLLFNKCVLLEVQHVEWYCSFLEMLETEGLQNVLPGVKAIEEGVQVYRKFYSEEEEKSSGVLAISVSKSTSQPFAPLAELLSGLNYEGVGCLLGMVHTAGTILDALPPPRSSLV